MGQFMANESIRIGIDFSKDMIRFIEAERWNGKMNLTNVLQAPLPTTFDYSTIGDVKLVPQFSDAIDKACESFNPKAKSARLCIDRRLAIKKTFAVDKGLSEDEIRQHIEWELEQLLIAPRDEYNVGFELTILDSKQSDIIVFVAVRKSLIRYLQDIFKKSRLELRGVDLDLFASERALEYAYPENLKGVSALIEFNHSGIGLTVLCNGKYALSNELPAVINQKEFQDLASADLVIPVQNELNKLLQNLQENLGISSVNRIFLSGESADKSLINDIERLFNDVPVMFVEPFKNMYRQLNIESQMLIDNHPENFLSCLGMVL